MSRSRLGPCNCKGNSGRRPSATSRALQAGLSVKNCGAAGGSCENMCAIGAANSARVALLICCSSRRDVQPCIGPRRNSAHVDSDSRIAGARGPEPSSPPELPCLGSPERRAAQRTPRHIQRLQWLMRLQTRFRPATLCDRLGPFWQGGDCKQNCGAALGSCKETCAPLAECQMGATNSLRLHCHAPWE